jgi:hypothetical protein
VKRKALHSFFTLLDPTTQYALSHLYYYPDNLSFSGPLMHYRSWSSFLYFELFQLHLSVFFKLSDTLDATSSPLHEFLDWPQASQTGADNLPRPDISLTEREASALLRKAHDQVTYLHIYHRSWPTLATPNIRHYFTVSSPRALRYRIVQYGKMSASSDRREIVIVGMTQLHFPHVTPHNRGAYWRTNLTDILQVVASSDVALPII